MTGAAALAWLLLLDAISLAWPHRDRSDRLLLLFVMVTLSWAIVVEGIQAWYAYRPAPIELAVVVMVGLLWLVLWSDRRDRKKRSEQGDRW